MSIKTVWNWILKIFKIEKSITSDRQRGENAHYTQKYKDIEDINFDAIISGKLARLAVAGSDFSIKGDTARAKFISEIGLNLWKKSKKIISMALGTGGVIIVPYVQNNNIYFDIATQDRLMINAKLGNRITDAVVLADKATIKSVEYFRYVHYKIENNNLFIENTVTTQSGKSAVVDMWKDIEDIKIANVDRVPFGFLKSPIDNRACSDDYGVPVTYGCDKLIDKIKKCLMRIEDEFELKQVMLRLDERDFDTDEKGNPILTSKLFMKAYGDTTEGDIFDIFDPAIRDSSFYNDFEKKCALLEKSIGLSRGILTEANATYENEQKVREAVGDTFAAVSEIRKAFKDAAEDFLYTCNVLANCYNITPAGEFETVFDWDYSMIESTTETWQQMKEGQAIGIRSKAELRAWQTGESIEDAQKAVDEIEKSEPNISTLFGVK